MTAPGGSSSTGPCFKRWRPVRVRTKREHHHCSSSQGRDHARREPDEPVAVTGQSRAPSKRQPPSQPKSRHPPLSTPPPRTDPSLSTCPATLPRDCSTH